MSSFLLLLVFVRDPALGELAAILGRFHRDRSCGTGGAKPGSLPELPCSFKAFPDSIKAYPDNKAAYDAAVRDRPGEALCIKLQRRAGRACEVHGTYRGVVALHPGVPPADELPDTNASR